MAKAKSTSTCKKGKPLERIDSFYILPLTMPKFSPKAPAPIHQLFFRPHESREIHDEEGRPADRTLFLSNAPVDATIADLRRIFRTCGKIEKVSFDGDLQTAMTSTLTSEVLPKAKGKKGGKKVQPPVDASSLSRPFPISTVEANPLRPLHASGSSAHIVFLEAAGVNKALALTQATRPWLDGADPKDDADLPLGLDRYRALHKLQRPSPNTLQEDADQAVVAYRRLQEQREQEAAAKFNLPDEEGFVTVTRTNRRGTATNKGTTVTAVSAEDVKHLKPKERTLVNFYNFQQREAKRDKLKDLRQKFEEDKIKIASMRDSRKFKPY